MLPGLALRSGMLWCFDSMCVPAAMVTERFCADSLKMLCSARPHLLCPVPFLQAQVELKVLQHLRHHDPEDMHHVIHIQEHFMFRNHLCITFELLSINLYEFIKQNNFQGLSLQLIKRFAQQMLVSLR